MGEAEPIRRDPAGVALARQESLARVLRLVGEPMAAVEREFESYLRSEIPLIERIGRYISQSGGKRIRPALLLLAARLTDLKDRTYQLRYYRAELNRDGGIASRIVGNQVSRSAENINLLEAGLIVPSRLGTFEVQLRLQDDQPDTPGDKDAEAAVELRWMHRF